MTEIRLAVGLAKRIVRSKRPTHLAFNHDTIEDLVSALDWKNCPLKAMPVCLALHLAELWLLAKVPRVKHLSESKPGDSSDESQAMTITVSDSHISECDLETMRVLLEFLLKAFEKVGQLKLASLLESFDLLGHCKKHASWAHKLREAVNYGLGGERNLAKELEAKRESIPIGFIVFLKSQSSSNPASCAYQEALLRGTHPDKLALFLPAADDAKKKSGAAARLTRFPPTFFPPFPAPISCPMSPVSCRPDDNSALRYISGPSGSTSGWSKPFEMAARTH